MRKTSVEEATEEIQKLRTDCEVCRMLVIEKHKNDFIWKVFFVLALAVAIIFAILYFGSGAIVTETTIEVGDDSYIGNRVDGNGSIESNVIVGSDNVSIGDESTKTDYSLVIIIAIIGVVAVLIVGGILYAHYHKKENYHYYWEQ